MRLEQSRAEPGKSTTAGAHARRCSAYPKPLHPQPQQNKAEQSRAHQSRAVQSRAEPRNSTTAGAHARRCAPPRARKVYAHASIATLLFARTIRAYASPQAHDRVGLLIQLTILQRCHPAHLACASRSKGRHRPTTFVSLADIQGSFSLLPRDTEEQSKGESRIHESLDLASVYGVPPLAFVLNNLEGQVCGLRVISQPDESEGIPFSSDAGNQFDVFSPQLDCSLKARAAPDVQERFDRAVDRTALQSCLTRVERNAATGTCERSFC